MTARVWTVFTIECQKAAYQRLTWLAPLFVLLVGLALPLLHPVAADGESDYAFVQFGAVLLNGNLLGFFVMIYGAHLLAPELSGGLARHVFVRPIHRADWYAGKLLFLMAYTLALALLGAAVPWGMALALGELSGVTFGGALLHTAGEMRTAYLQGWALSIPPLWAAGAFAFMLSALSKNALSAAGLAIVLWVVADVAKYPLGIELWLFSTWLEGVWQPFGAMAGGLPPHWDKVLRWSLASSAFIFALAGFAGLLVVQRRSLGK